VGDRGPPPDVVAVDGLGTKSSSRSSEASAACRASVIAQPVNVGQERIRAALDGGADRERRDDVGPPVTDVRHEFLEHREGDGLARAGVLHPAREPRHVTEGGPGGEEAGDFEIRVEAGLGPAQ
jgi:hypothetical protein